MKFVRIKKGNDKKLHKRSRTLVQYCKNYSLLVIHLIELVHLFVSCFTNREISQK